MRQLISYVGQITLLISLVAADVFGVAHERPYVLFIAIDDLNDWVGVLGGHPQVRTPHMDRLAQRGLLFTNAWGRIILLAVVFLIVTGFLWIQRILDVDI